MGRWAEVYFTSPPEKREEAVLELLRELQGDDSRREDGVTSAPQAQGTAEQKQDHAARLAVAPTSQIAGVEETLAPCPVCGWANPVSHRFCGMCGQSVMEPKSVADLEIADLHVENRIVESPHIETPYSEAPRQDAAQNNRPQYAPDNVVYEPPPSSNESPLFHAGRDDRADRSDDRDDGRNADRNEDRSNDRNDDIFSYSAAPRSYRVHIGIALAIVIFALGYVAWRSMQLTSQHAHVGPLPPPAAATEPATPSFAPTTTSNPVAPDRPPSANLQAGVPSPTDPPSGNAGSGSGRPEPANAAPTANPAIERNLPSETFGGYGAEELATAQRFLNGVGEERNHAEAAKWLWKAVAKHNADAPLLLSDLYLRGDGVSKSCDQARVLLDAAARRGTKDAGERLRHLQAFGCQ